MLEKVSETLAGRAVYVTLWPLTRRERHGLGRAGLWSELLASPFQAWREILASRDSPVENWRDAVRLGGLPVPATGLATDKQRAVWFSGYVSGTDTFPLTRRVLAAPWWQVC